MPGMWIGGLGDISTVGNNAAASAGTTVTGGGSANTVGSYAQLTATTPHDAHAIIVYGRTTNNGQSMLVDIAIGGAGSEQVVVSRLLFQGPRSVMAYYLPIYIPGGVRLAARSQNTSGSGTGLVMVTMLRYQFGAAPALSRATVYGAATADSGGTSVDPGGSGNTKGSYTQITSSTTRAHKGIMLAVQQDKNTATTQADWLFDIAIGGAGSEIIVAPDLWVNNGQTGLGPASPTVTYPFMIAIPASTRLAVRAQCSITDATDRLNDVILIGVD